MGPHRIPYQAPKVRASPSLRKGSRGGPLRAWSPLSWPRSTPLLAEWPPLAHHRDAPPLDRGFDLWIPRRRHRDDQSSNYGRIPHTSPWLTGPVPGQLLDDVVFSIAALHSLLSLLHSGFSFSTSCFGPDLYRTRFARDPFLRWLIQWERVIGGPSSSGWSFDSDRGSRGSCAPVFCFPGILRSRLLDRRHVGE